MATAFNQFKDKELLLSRIKDLEFVDDVSEFQCKRCEKVLIQHYIANCGHAFCSNCKKLLGDGSGRWRCPECQEYVKEIDFQDFEFERKLFELRVRCANNKYGCSFTCLLKELKEHLKTCEFTRENALPVIYKETNTTEAVFEQLLAFNKKLDKLNVDMERMEEKIIKIETNQETFDNKLKKIDDRFDRVNSVLPEQTSRVNTKIGNLKSSKIPDELTSTIDSMKSNILNLNKKSDLWLEVLEMKDEKINNAINRLKQEFKDDVKNLSFPLQDAIETIAGKLHEVNTNFTMQLKNTDNKIDLNQKELTVLKSKTASCLDKNDELARITQTLREKNICVTKNLLEKENKIEIINKELATLELLKIKLRSRMEANNQLLVNVDTCQLEDLVVTTKLNELESQMKLIKPHLLRLESYMNLMKLQIRPITLKNTYLNRLTDFVWQIPDAKNLMKQDTWKDMESEPFQLNDYPFAAQAKLSFTVDSFCASVTFNPGSGSPLLPLQPSMYLIIRSQVEKRDGDIVKLASKEFQSPLNSDYVFEKIAKSKVSGLFNRYVKNNTLLLEFHVEPPAMTKHVYSYDGTLSWAIDNYKKRTEWAAPAGFVAFHESPYFYTGSDGYRVQLRFWLDADGYVFASVHFLTGEFDHLLKREAPHKITITYLNQKNPIGHVEISKIYDPKTIENLNFNTYFGSHCSIIGDREEIENTVANDTLYYHAKIETI